MVVCRWRPLPLSSIGQVLRRRHSTMQSMDIGQPTAASHPQLLKEGEITSGITAMEYVSRRKRFLELLPENSLGIIASAPVKMMTDVVPYTFRQEADYMYLTGCTQPGGIAILSHEFGLCMFMPEQEPHDIIWEGQVAGVDVALNTFKADQAFPLSHLHKILPNIIKKSRKLFHCKSTANSAYLNLDAFRDAQSSGKVNDISKYTHELRWLKSISELKLMKESALIASEALLKAIGQSRIYPHEGKLAAIVEYECKMKGAQKMAFNPVVGGGSNACVIHYSRNDQEINSGDLVLLDMGCELHGYVSDLTRTWPPCGRFSSAQKDLYNLVLETNKECLKLCRPGIGIGEINAYSVEMLHRGFKKLGILKEDCSSYQRYHKLNPTSIGHYLGMDVHDCSEISIGRPLEPGVVITIEPGIYVPNNFDCPKWFQGTGIRIEDEVLITASGHEVLTYLLPKEIEELDNLIN